MKKYPVSKTTEIIEDLLDVYRTKGRNADVEKSVKAYLKAITNAVRFTVAGGIDAMLDDEGMPKALPEQWDNLPYPVCTLEIVDPDPGGTDWYLVMMDAKKIDGRMEEKPGFRTPAFGVMVLPLMRFKNVAVFGQKEPWAMALTGAWIGEQAPDIGDTGTFILSTIPESEVHYAAFNLSGFDDLMREMNEGFDWTPEDIREYRGHVTEMSTTLTVHWLRALHCSKVVWDDAPAPVKLNRKRAKKNRVPFFEHKVVTINPTRKQRLMPVSSDDHRRSPRLHMRRGHVRRYKSGKVRFIKPMIVGDKSRGMVLHDYEVKR